ncbi:MAG: hypothetical protein P4L36_01555 [Holophaga sp.]|nr:hypothetical protein [Holophaga sp.]
MNPNQQTENVTRESILKLLSDDEVARVCTAETALRLSEKDEYIDLDHLECGIQEAHDGGTVMGTALPRKAVHEKTWIKVQAAVAAFCCAKAPLA